MSRVIPPISHRDGTLLMSYLLHSSLAQLAEHSTVNRRVAGSSPAGGAHRSRSRQTPAAGPFCVSDEVHFHFEETLGLGHDCSESLALGGRRAGLARVPLMR